MVFCRNVIKGRHNNFRCKGVSQIVRLWFYFHDDINMRTHLQVVVLFNTTRYPNRSFHCKRILFDKKTIQSASKIHFDTVICVRMCMKHDFFYLLCGVTAYFIHAFLHLLSNSLTLLETKSIVFSNSVFFLLNKIDPHFLLGNPPIQVNYSFRNTI